MSSRWYPLYQKGNPQLRIFLPNYFMKLVKHKHPNAPPNQLEFHVSMGMSNADVKNYLTKIYNIPVVSVRTVITQGRFKRAGEKQYIIKEDDYKKAYVYLPADQKFEFPDLFPKDKVDSELEQQEKAKTQIQASRDEAKERNKLRPTVPTWFA